MKRFRGLFLFAAFSAFFFVSDIYSTGIASPSNKKPSQYPDIASNRTLAFYSKFNGKVIVIDDGEYRSLIFGSENNRATQSKVSLKDPAKLLFNYTECSMLGFSLFRDPGKEVKDVLMIGLGGGSLPRFIKKSYPHANIDNVDIDPLIVDIAKKYFFVREGNGFNIFIEDGRKFVENARKKYDVIILDAFGADSDVPRQLTSFEFLGRLKAHLSPQGIVITNFINHEQNKYESFVATYKSAFKFVMRFNLEKLNYTNVVMISYDDNLKNYDQEKFSSRVDEFSKSLNSEYDLQRFVMLRNNDVINEKNVEIIHDK
jgi:spermidine synthase